MKHGKIELYEIKVWDDGIVRARRHDRQPMTYQDWDTVENRVEASQSVAVADALRIFGGRVLSPEEGQEIMAEDADWAAIQAEQLQKVIRKGRNR